MANDYKYKKFVKNEKKKVIVTKDQKKSLKIRFYLIGTKYLTIPIDLKNTGINIMGTDYKSLIPKLYPWIYFKMKLCLI